MSHLTVVVPAYNEATVLEAFHARLARVLDELPMECSVLYVDDGSSDHTWSLIESLISRDARTGALKLSRNFGNEAARTASLDHVDADLQDPPELIPSRVERWHAGYDVVYATRTAREGESAFKRLTASLFYRSMERLSPIPACRATPAISACSRAAPSTRCASCASGSVS